MPGVCGTTLVLVICGRRFIQNGLSPELVAKVCQLLHHVLLLVTHDFIGLPSQRERYVAVLRNEAIIYGFCPQVFYA
jgi:hypothetical protein